MISKSLMLISDTGGGKTTQSGEVAAWIMETLQQFTVYYGSILEHPEPILPLTRVFVKGRPIIHMEIMDDLIDPWYWLYQVSEGNVRVDGKWVKPPDGVGLRIYDGASGFCEELLKKCAADAAEGIAIGGHKPFSTVISPPDAKEEIRVGANNPSHFGVIQQKMFDYMGRSAMLPGELVIWTARPAGGTDEEDSKVVGPKIAGKAITAHVPSWFTYCLRIESVTRPNLPPMKRLYLQEHKTNVGTKDAYGNARYPLRAKTKLPLYIDDADVVKALQLIKEGEKEAIAHYLDRFKKFGATSN